MASNPAQTVETPFNLVGSFSKSKFSRFDGERTVNLYEVFDAGTEKQRALFPFPGYELLQTLPSSPFTRASIVQFGILYWIAGQNVFKMNELLVPTKIGELTTFSGHIGIASNSTQLIIVDGAKGYIYTYATGVFQQITDANFPALPTAAVFLDGLFLVSAGGTNLFYQSQLNNGLNWTYGSGPATGALTTQPDIIVGMAVLHRRLFIFGSVCTEVWYNAGATTNLAFRRDNNLLLPYGCGAVDSIQVDYGRLFFLASQSNGTNQVMMTTGSIPQKITPWQLEEALQGYSDASDAYGVIFKISGMVFYVFSVTQDNQTWVYNVDTDRWSEAEEVAGKRSIIQTHVYYNGQHLIGSYKDGGIYNFSDSIYDNDGHQIRRLRITQPFYDPRYRKISIDRIELDCIRGVGTPDGDDEYPEIFMAVSIDGGNSYPVQRKVQTGAQGNFRQRAIFRKLGSAYDFVFMIQYYNRTKFSIMGGSLCYTVQDRMGN